MVDSCINCVGCIVASLRFPESIPPILRQIEHRLGNFSLASAPANANFWSAAAVLHPRDGSLSPFPNAFTGIPPICHGSYRGSIIPTRCPKGLLMSRCGRRQYLPRSVGAPFFRERLIMKPTNSGRFDSRDMLRRADLDRTDAYLQKLLGPLRKAGLRPDDPLLVAAESACDDLMSLKISLRALDLEIRRRLKTQNAATRPPDASGSLNRPHRD